MAHEKAIAEGFDSLWDKSSERNWILGRLGLPGGGTPVFDVPDKPGYKYVNRGAAGEQGQVIARDPIGVVDTYNQRVRMRREFGEYVIREAEQIAGGSGGGASNLNALTDVTLTTPANGNVLAYNSASSQWINVVPAGGAGGAPSPHAHSSIHHTGLLPWAELNKSGSSLADLATRQHSVLQGMTPNDHHDQAHVLATGTALGADHTISGAAVGEVLRALSATTAAFDVLQHTDLGNVLPDQHHQRVHDIITGDTIGTVTGPVHTVVGADYTVIGVHPINTLSVLPTSNAPGAAISILRTDANGGIQLDTNLLYVDAANNRIGVNRTPGGATLDIIAFANADHTQRIKQKSGQTGRMWRIEDTGGSELIVLDSVGNLQSGHPGFVSGLTGWQITPQGNAEFNNIWARGELHATVFVKDEVHATGGSMLVATAGVLHDDANISSSVIDDDVLVVYSTPAGQGVPLQVVTTSGAFVGNELHISFIGNTININDPPSGPGFYFQPGDVIRSKTEIDTGVTDFWLEVNNAVQFSGYSTYSVTKRSGTDGVLPKGSAVVSYGREGDGRILMTSDLNYAPYIDVFTVGPNVWTGDAGSVVPRMRMGRLDGIGLPGISGVPQYGMIAGKDLSDANSGYLIASNLQFSLYKIDIRLNDGSNDTGLWTANGDLKIGKNVGASATTGLQFSTVTGDVVIGNTATGNFLRWQQATGILTVAGSLVVSDPGTTVTKTYVDTQDADYDAKAGGTYTANGVLGGYALVAQTGAQNYSNATRISGVTGTWTSTAANVVTWTGLTATFVNGGSRSIANGNTGSMSVRTYLYANVALAGTLTLIPLTTPAVSQPTYVLIAVCEPGTRKASVTVVAGTTFISGSNIFTGSIEANHLVANSIDTAQLTVTYNNSINTISSTATTANAAAGTAQTTANNAATKAQQGVDDAADALAAAGTAQTSAQAYGDSRRVVGVSGTWTVFDGNTIGWASLAVKFANGSARTITAQSSVSFIPAGRWYLYVDVSGPATMPMEPPTQSIGSLGVNDVLIAVVDTGTLKASISIVAGSTYISGGNILTGSIVAANIAASQITADLLLVGTLGGIGGINNDNAVNSGPLNINGALTINTTGNIRSTGKTAYGNTTPGFFLGWDTNGPDAYKLDIGDGNSALQWDGSDLFITTKQAISINNTNTGQVLSVRGPSGAAAVLTLNASNVLVSSNTLNAPLITATKLINTGDTFQMQTPRKSITSNLALGIVGEMAWDYDGTGALWLYFCYATNFWRRIQFPTTAW